MTTPKKPKASAEDKTTFMMIIAKASHRIGKVRYVVLEELCDTYDEMAWFYNAIIEAGLEIDGPIPDRVKHAFKEYGINIY